MNRLCSDLQSGGNAPAEDQVDAGGQEAHHHQEEEEGGKERLDKIFFQTSQVISEVDCLDLESVRCNEVRSLTIIIMKFISIVHYSKHNIY